MRQSREADFRQLIERMTSHGRFRSSWPIVSGTSDEGKNEKAKCGEFREFGCSAQTIANWVAQEAINRRKPLPGKDGMSSAEREALNRLRRENRQLKTERDILAMATT